MTLPTTSLPPDELSPDMRAFQQRLAAAYAEHPPLEGLSLNEVRRVVERVREPLAAGGPSMWRSSECTIPAPGPGGQVGPLRLRIHEPAPGPQRPALVFVHGGGWVFFSLDTHDRLMREYAARTGRVVIGVDYAQAPEVRYPVAVQQTAATLAWARAEADRLGLDPHRIAVGGDSAGANLSVAATLWQRAQGQPLPEALLLLYGVFDDNFETESMHRFDGPGYVLGREEMRGFWQQYLRDAADWQDPIAMPLKADLQGLPRCGLVVAECDVLRDSSLALADKLSRSGVPVTLMRCAGAPHSFLEAHGFAPTAERALARSADWLAGKAPQP